MKPYYLIVWVRLKDSEIKISSFHWIKLTTLYFFN
jgi:hypothetical protein